MAGETHPMQDHEEPRAALDLTPGEEDVDVELPQMPTMAPTGPITRRAAERLAAREGREVRIPREPSPGIDPDVEDLASPGGPSTASTAGPSTASIAGPGAVSTSTPSPGTAIGTAGPDLGSSA